MTKGKEISAHSSSRSSCWMTAREWKLLPGHVCHNIGGTTVLGYVCPKFFSDLYLITPRLVRV
jgi:hypothetical protein